MSGYLREENAGLRDSLENTPPDLHYRPDIYQSKPYTQY